MIYKWLTIQMKCHREPDFLHGFLTIILDDRTNHTVINHIKESTYCFYIMRSNTAVNTLIRDH